MRGSRRRLCSTLCRCSSISLTAARASRRTKRVDDGDVLGEEVLGRMRRTGTSARSARSARHQIGQRVGQRLVAQHLRDERVEIGQQPRAAGDIGALHGGLLVAQVGAQLGELGVAQLAGGARIIADSSMCRTSNTWRASSMLGSATCAARQLERDQLVAAELVDALARQGAWTLKMSAIFCSASLVPGIRRRSTMAEVIDSTMRCPCWCQASTLARGLLFAGLRTTCREGCRVPWKCLIRSSKCTL